MDLTDRAWNLPNALTVLRIFLVPLLVVVLLTRFEGLGWRFEALDCGSPITLAEGEPDEGTRRLIASITARYSDRRSEPLVEVAARRGPREERLVVPPAADGVLETYRI